MKPSDILSSEHRVIEQVLNCLELIAKRAEDYGNLDEQSAGETIDFLRAFADRCHHGKEELHFFPAMEAKGFSRESGPTGVMLYEHDLGRHRVSEMGKALDAFKAGDLLRAKRFAEHARAYIALLRNHIEKEDHCLFNMANQAFTEADQQQLLDAFAKAESESMGHKTHETYLRITERLAERYDVVTSQSAPTLCGGCAHKAPRCDGEHHA